MSAADITAAGSTRRDERRAMGVACGAHALHDGYTDLIYVMLPIWQAEFALSYAAIGALRGVFAGTMAGFQIPAGLLSERLGTPLVLAAGTALAGLGYCLAPLVDSYAALIAILFAAGLGASTQHPLASALVARAYAGARSLAALGTYNFAGDLGKMALPAGAALLVMVLPWRVSLALVGLIGFVAALAILLVTPRYAAEETKPSTGGPDGAGASSGAGGFPVLLSIGVIDSATRMGFLTFLPFLLTAKGASLPTVGLALTLVFVGGAAGKLVCAWIGARIGVTATVWLTEGLTALGMLALLPLPLEPGLLLLPVIGVALNGTSSVLYGSVPVLVAPASRTRAFSVFYTGTIGAGALAPVVYGFVGDALGVPLTMVLIAGIVLTTLPLVLLIRGRLISAALKA
ncbi:MAG: MFS transporter [Alphaproteobacteria bacterium]|nr:MAG: MFS transporter [Alphaproteobacteria bacterium]